MNESDYLLAWSIYAAAALGCFLVFWWSTGWLWQWLREPLRVLVLVLLVTPTVVDAGRELLAPAIAVLSMDLLFKISGSSVRAIADLVMFGVMGAVAYTIFVIARWLIWREKEAPQPDSRTLREHLADDDDDYPAPRRPGERITPRL